MFSIHSSRARTAGSVLFLRLGVMDNPERLIRFDWAIKSLLRDKANFDIMEGFLSALLKSRITIQEVLESESNQDAEKQKFNRVDILVRDGENRLFIIEVQAETESDYLERLLFGTCKTVVDNLKVGEPYRNIKKVISISIMYFNLGRGNDYLYHGRTEVQGGAYRRNSGSSEGQPNHRREQPDCPCH